LKLNNKLRSNKRGSGGAGKGEARCTAASMESVLQNRHCSAHLDRQYRAPGGLGHFHFALQPDLAVGGLIQLRITFCWISATTDSATELTASVRPSSAASCALSSASWQPVPGYRDSPGVSALPRAVFVVSRQPFFLGFLLLFLLFGLLRLTLVQLFLLLSLGHVVDPALLQLQLFAFCLLRLSCVALSCSCFNCSCCRRSCS
jgi:hypothetical protein